MKAVYALYDDPNAALRAVNGLRAAGIADRDIAVMTADPIEGHALMAREAHTWMPWVAACGAVVGLVLAVGMLLWGELAWRLDTGGMPVVAWWPNLIIMFELTMLSAILTTVGTLFVTAGIPSRREKLYDAEIADGKILVGVKDPPDTSIASLQQALLAGGGRVKRV
ncbi:MAG: DUF3341 domain-containing protein [Acidobacteria bacterium]|nr:DUF3341 domain-containing protein [Acidobacteriota bacterium]